MQRKSVSKVKPGAPASDSKPASPPRECGPFALSAADEAVLSGITISGEFTLDKVLTMYEGVSPLWSQTDSSDEGLP